MSKLTLEVNANFKENKDVAALASRGLLVTPPVGENYWLFRVKVSDNQSVIGFPKFGVIGIGFEKEEKDWNTNLPSQCDAIEIYNHIKVNKGKNIRKEKCVKAIILIQEAASDLLSKMYPQKDNTGQNK